MKNKLDYNIKFGNWYVTDETIEWREGDNIETDYFIDKERMLEQDEKGMYSWLTHIPKKTWVSVKDTYALNTAFIYAMEKFNIEFNKLSFVKTLQLQNLIIKDKSDY